MTPPNQPAARKRWPRWVRVLLWIVGVTYLISAVLGFGMRRYSAANGGTAVTQAKAKLKNIEVLLWMRKTLGGGYPTEAQGLQDLLRTSDPKRAEAAAEKLKDPWHRPFKYQIPGVHHPESYDLYSLGPDGIEGTEDDITNW